MMMERGAEVLERKGMSEGFGDKEAVPSMSRGEGVEVAGVKREQRVLEGEGRERDILVRWDTHRIVPWTRWLLMTAKGNSPQV